MTNNSLAAGFETPIVEIVAVILVLFGLGVALVIYNYKRERKLQIQRAEASIARYNDLVLQRGLTRSDRNVLERLIAYIPRSIEPFRLLEQQGVFTRAATMALDDSEVGPGQVSALRVKLGFVGRALGMQIRSSVDLPIGASVSLQPRYGAPQSARVIQSDQTVLRVEIEDGDLTRFTGGRRIRVSYQNAAGIFSFDSAVLGREDEAVALQHSERITVQQQRRYFRTSLAIPVSIIGVDPPHPEPVTAEFVDVGGGGASLTNPLGTFHAGDWVDLVFGQADRSPLTVPSTVIRTSNGNSILHVEYRNLREATRDKVYRLLFLSEIDE